MGTRFEIVAGGEDPLLLRAAVEEAFEEISSCHRLWNVFAHDSLLSRIHTEAFLRPVAIDGLTLDLLRECARLYQQTSGCFDPVIGADLAAGDPRREALVGAAPRDGFAGVDLDIKKGTVRLLDPQLRFDLGGVAKGYACDLAASILLEAGVSCALIHGGTSSVVAIGAPPGRKDWAIEIKGREQETVFLKDRCLAVSCPSGGGHEHIVDPSTGQRIDGHRPGAMVTGASATDCDAWATALTVAGFDGELAGRLPASLTGCPIESNQSPEMQSGAGTPVEEERWKRTVEIS